MLVNNVTIDKLHDYGCHGNYLGGVWTNDLLNYQKTCVKYRIVQVLYAKAAEIVWKQDKFKNIVNITVGLFHTICDLLSIIRK